MPLRSSPCPDYLSSQWRLWDQLEKYVLQERSLSLLFKEICPSNSVLEQVLLKVSALNDLYSTNIFDTYTVAKHIHEMNIEPRLRIGGLPLVNEIAMVTFGEKEKYFYSFATKYCSLHFPDSYPIYDSYVDKMLWYYAGTDNFSSFRRKDLKDYESFFRIIREFQDHYQLGQFSLRHIDKFLWFTGKYSFPPVIKKKKAL